MKKMRKNFDPLSKVSLLLLYTKICIVIKVLLVHFLMLEFNMLVALLTSLDGLRRIVETSDNICSFIIEQQLQKVICDVDDHRIPLNSTIIQKVSFFALISSENKQDCQQLLISKIIKYMKETLDLNQNDALKDGSMENVRQSIDFIIQILKKMAINEKQIILPNDYMQLLSLLFAYCNSLMTYDANAIRWVEALCQLISFNQM